MTAEPNHSYGMLPLGVGNFAFDLVKHSREGVASFARATSFMRPRLSEQRLLDGTAHALEIEVGAQCPDHETLQLLRATVREDAVVAQDLQGENGGGSVQHYEINAAAEGRLQLDPQPGQLERIGRIVTEEHGEVDVAVGPEPPRDSRAEQQHGGRIQLVLDRRDRVA